MITTKNTFTMEQFLLSLSAFLSMRSYEGLETTGQYVIFHNYAYEIFQTDPHDDVVITCYLDTTSNGICVRDLNLNKN